MKQSETMSDRDERILGAVFAVAGLGLLYHFVYSPWTDMVIGASQVQYSFKSVIVGPLCIFIGLVQLIFGARAPYLLGRAGGLRIKSLLVGLGVFAASASVYFWLNYQATILGYVPE